MVDLVPAEDIERIVGVQRHPTEHWAKAVSAEEKVYILHSAECLASGIDLRECRFSEVLADLGIEPEDWPQDEPVRVIVDEWGMLLPAQQVEP